MKYQNHRIKKLLSNYMNNNSNIRTNDFGNLSNSPPRQNKFINMPEQNNKIKNRN